MTTSTRLRRTAILAVAVVDVLAWVVADAGRGLAGAVLGLTLLVFFFAGSRAPKTFADVVSSGVLFLAISTGYVIRVVLLLLVLLRLGDADWLSRDAVGGTVIVGALCWSVALVHQQLYSRQPTLVIPPSISAGTGGALR